MLIFFFFFFKSMLENDSFPHNAIKISIHQSSSHFIAFHNQKIISYRQFQQIIDNPIELTTILFFSFFLLVCKLEKILYFGCLGIWITTICVWDRE